MYNIDVFTTLNIVISNSHLVLKEQLKEAMDELGRLREARERQKEMVKAIVNQRDMYQLGMGIVDILAYDYCKAKISRLSRLLLQLYLC